MKQAEADASDAALFEVAVQSFGSIADPLVGTIETDAPLARVDYGAGGGTMKFVAQLRTGKLGLSKPTRVGDWGGPFRVIAAAVVSVNQTQLQAVAMKAARTVCGSATRMRRADLLGTRQRS